jgi:hypothetical protein
MSVKGFNIDGEIQRVDFDSLDNLPFYERESTILPILEFNDVKFTSNPEAPEGFVTAMLNDYIEPSVVEINSDKYYAYLDGELICDSEGNPKPFPLNSDDPLLVFGDMNIMASPETAKENDFIIQISTNPQQPMGVIAIKSNVLTHSFKIVYDCSEPREIIPEGTKLENQSGASNSKVFGVEVPFIAGPGLQIEASIGGKIPEETIPISGITEVKTIDGEQYTVIGNLGKMGVGEDTGENYVVSMSPGYITLAYFTDDTTITPNDDGTYNISLKILGGKELKKIDSKFIKLDLPAVVGTTGEGKNSELHNNIEENQASGNYSFAEGDSTKASGSCSHAEGSDTEASGHSSHAEGGNTVASGQDAHAEGYYSKATGYVSHAEGYHTIASGNYQHVQGQYNIEDSSGHYFHIIGNGSSDTSRRNIHTVNYNGAAWYNDSITTEGSLKAKGNLYVNGNLYKGGADENSTPTILSFIKSGTGANSELFNLAKEAAGYCSHAEGSQTTASGEASHAEGYNTRAKAYYSHAEGDDTEATGGMSHAENYKTVASGDYSHAEGNYSKATNTCTHAEGYNTEANGMYSHAEGFISIVNGAYSHVEGYNTLASSDYQHVQGKYNLEDTENKYAHIVGNGAGGLSLERSNAHTLDWDGNAWYAGSVEAVNGLIVKSSTEGSTKRFKITVDDNGTLSATEIVE